MDISGSDVQLIIKETPKKKNKKIKKTTKKLLRISPNARKLVKAESLDPLNISDDELEENCTLTGKTKYLIHKLEIVLILYIMIPVNIILLLWIF